MHASDSFWSSEVFQCLFEKVYGLLDTYMLNSLDVLLEGGVSDMMVIRSISSIWRFIFLHFFLLQSNKQWSIRHIHAEIFRRLTGRGWFRYDSDQEHCFNLTFYGLLFFSYRAINNGLLDTYMLKSLDGLLEGDVSDMMVVKRPDGKLVLGLPEDVELLKDTRKKIREGRMDEIKVSELYDGDVETVETLDFGVPDNFALRDPYDRIIRCLGFKFDFDIFNK